MRLAVLLTAALLAAAIACSGQSDVELPGTTLNLAQAPDFRLADQDGREVALSALRGRPVVLTFLYTTCPDFCPLTAEKLRETLERLGSDASKVSVLAVSVDPERDDQQAAQAFTAAHRLTGMSWHYLIGSEAELSRVWSSYGIARLARGAGGPATGAPLSDAVGHTEALYVLDSQGRERTLLRGDFDPAALAGGLRKLLK